MRLVLRWQHVAAACRSSAAAAAAPPPTTAKNTGETLPQPSQFFCIGSNEQGSHLLLLKDVAKLVSRRAKKRTTRLYNKRE
jgi:hypothetical protein